MEDQTLNPYQGPPAGATTTLRAFPVLRDLSVSLALALLVLVAYWGVWHYQFIYFDDPGYVSDNLNVTRGLPLVKSPAVFRDNVRWAFTAFEQSNWHPLTWLSHMLDVQLYGLNAGGHHVTNIILHIGNVLLLFWLFRWMTKRTWAAAAVAALFAVHPMHVESVVWVAERKDVLSTFLGIATLLVYVAYTRRVKFKADLMILLIVLSLFSWIFTLLCLKSFSSGRPETLAVWFLWVFPAVFIGTLIYAIATGRWNMLVYCAVFLLFAIGLLAKPMLITLPCLCLLLDFWPLNRLRFTSDGPPVLALIERPAAALRRRAKRNQRLPGTRVRVAARVAPDRQRSGESLVMQIVFLVMEKVPLFFLSAISAIITPYAQAHGGSMAATNDLSVSFRLENAIQSYMTYIDRMFWPGRMTTLYLLDVNHVNHRFTALAICTLLMITGLVVWGAIMGRRYLVFGWLWYLGTLVPVIGLVQVGEQTHADRYTYIPYVGLFVMLAWGIADLIGILSRKMGTENGDSPHLCAAPSGPSRQMGTVPVFRLVLQCAVALAMSAILAVCVGWTKFQLKFWPNAEAHMRHALSIEPDNWNMLNNLGVYLWKEAQKQEKLAGEADAIGKADEAATCREKSDAFKEDAMAQWNHGIDSRSTATDICSNLGYAYSEKASRTPDPEESKRYLDLAEKYLWKAVQLKDISPRPHNNLGRVLLRRSQQCETDANAVEAKGKTAPAEAAKVAPLREQAKLKLDQAIGQFERAVDLDPSLLEARLNLGEVFIQLGGREKQAAEHEKAEKHDDKGAEDLAKAEANYAKAEGHYKEILKFDNPTVVDPDAIANFSQAALGLARIALERNKPEEAIPWLKRSVARNPNNLTSIQLLVVQLYLHEDYHEGDKVVWLWLSKLPVKARRVTAEQFGGQFEQSKKHAQAVRAWGIMAWIFATSPEPQLRDPEEAAKLSQALVNMTNKQDPLAIDTFAATAASMGQFPNAIQAAQAAIDLANRQGNKPLADMIARRLQGYQARTPHAGDPAGSDRP